MAFAAVTFGVKVRLRVKFWAERFAIASVFEPESCLVEAARVDPREFCALRPFCPEETFVEVSA